MDIQEINIGVSNDGPELNVIEKNGSGLSNKKSVNFGPGADLLMNPNKQKQQNKQHPPPQQQLLLLPVNGLIEAVGGMKESNQQ